jgi:cytoskeletal protein RodZ
MSQSKERAVDDQRDSSITPFRDVNAETVPRRIGEQLISARLAKGLEIEDVARHLHIRREYLQALEAGIFDDIPGATYIAGFLRSYANHLGLDGDEMVRMFKDESGGALVRQNLYFPIPASEARRPTGTMIIGALLVAIIALALWYAINERQLVDIDLVPPVPDFLDQSSDEDRVVLAVQDVGQNDAGSTDAESLLADEPTGPAQTEDDDEGVPQASIRSEPDAVARDGDAGEGVPATTEPASTEADQEVDVSVETTEPVDEVTVPEVPPEPEPDAVAVDEGTAADLTETALGESAAADEDYVPRVYGRTNANSRVEIRAIDTSWVQIEAPGNQVLLTRVLLPGDVYRVPNGERITLKTGNAGGLELRVDGELIEPLGEAGVVIKDVVLDPDALLER